jgi:uncharacterized pyridoxamine 5'-phosphate oxidase family protein
MKAAVLATAAHDDASITLLLSFVSVNFSKKKQIFMIIAKLFKALFETSTLIKKKQHQHIKKNPKVSICRSKQKRKMFLLLRKIEHNEGAFCI